MSESPKATPTRGRGRPRVGPVITLALPSDLLADLDAEARARDLTRAEVIRERLERLRWDRTGGQA